MDSIGYLGIFVALIGLALGFWGFTANRRASALREAATRWREAPGKVVLSEVDQRGSSVSSSRYAYFVPIVHYTYVVNGRERQGTRLRFGLPRSRSPSGARAMLAPYPVGAAVTVRYDPDDPDQAVLEPAKGSLNLLLAAIAGALVFLGGAVIVVLAVRGTFSSDVSGHWHVRFQADNVAYEGDLEAVHGAGPLTVAFNGQDGRKRAREDCTLTRNRQRVLVRCANPQVIEGTGTYSPDNFDLTYDGPSRLSGSITSNGADVGAATFTR